MKKSFTIHRVTYVRLYLRMCALFMPGWSENMFLKIMKRKSLCCAKLLLFTILKIPEIRQHITEITQIFHLQQLPESRHIRNTGQSWSVTQLNKSHQITTEEDQMVSSLYQSVVLWSSLLSPWLPWADPVIGVTKLWQLFNQSSHLALLSWSE